MAHQSLRKTALSLALSLAGAAALASACATTRNPGTPSDASSAQNDAAMGNSPSSALAAADRRFLEEAAQGALMEVQLGNYAAAHASNEQVKQFGQRMVADHSKANDELKALATSKGVTLPTSLDSVHQHEMANFTRAGSATFDRTYMQHMVEDHTKDVKKFDAQAKNGTDADVKAFAAKTLPTLQEHLTLAQSTFDAVR
jgi:putative membrane protein